MMSVVQHNCQKTEQCNQEDLGKTIVIKTTLPVTLVVSTKWRTFHSFQEEEISERLPKNIVRTAKRQLDRHHLLFGEYYFAVQNNPLTPKLANQHEQLKMNLTLIKVSMF